MKAWEVLAIAVEGELVCSECTQTKEERKAFKDTVEDMPPLFVSDADGTEVCGRCGNPIQE
jgi:hypothetical protein